MATIFEDNFNSYNDGDLNGQGGWSDSVQFDVQGTVVKEGAKAVIGNNGGDFLISKTGTASTDGKLTFYFRTLNHSSFGSGQYFEFRAHISGGDTTCWALQIHQDGYLKGINNTTWENIQAYVDDQWYCVEVEWRSSPDYKYRVRVNGGAWTGWKSGYFGYTWSTGLNTVRLDSWLTAGSCYIDYIAENPISAGLPPRSLAFIIG